MLPALVRRIPEMEEWKDFSRQDIEDAETIFGALAPKTRVSYMNHLKRFLREGYQLNGRSLVQWIHHSRKKGLAPGSIKVQVAAIRKYCAASGREISGIENELIKAALKRANRANREFGRGSVDGANWEDADRAATKAALFGDRTGIRDSAIIRIASDGLLRTAEVSALDVSDIEIDETGTGQIHIQSSKTDQEGEGFLFFIGPATMKAILSWLDVSGIIEGALFPSTRGRGVGKRMSPPAIRYAITKRLKAIGMEGRLAGHSLRRGAAASLVLAGASIPEIQEAGRWKDPRLVHRYVAGELAEHGVVAKYRYGNGD